MTATRAKSTQARALTYEDLLKTPEGDGNRYELLGGEIFVTASPSKKHVWLVNLLTFELTAQLRGRNLGQVFAGPVDVRLTPHDVVVPDIVFIRQERLHIFGERCIEGAPDLIVEVLSPSTRSRDLTIKMQLYARTGVQEYWLVDPDLSTITVYVLFTTGGYEALAPAADSVASRVLSGIQLNPALLFAEVR
ncbi:MAG: Uma2 family endonuclease [Thermomicrobiales bacterium]|nr:Uma2 family endonuclease [Thermomicrobiales bacterium]